MVVGVTFEMEFFDKLLVCCALTAAAAAAAAAAAEIDDELLAVAEADFVLEDV